jgi:hypothetical protein
MLIGGEEKHAHMVSSDENLVLLVSSPPPQPTKGKGVGGGASGKGVDEVGSGKGVGGVVSSKGVGSGKGGAVADTGRERTNSDDESIPVPLIVGKQRLIFETQFAEGENTKTECKLFINICTGGDLPIGCWAVNQVWQHSQHQDIFSNVCFVIVRSPRFES